MISKVFKRIGTQQVRAGGISLLTALVFTACATQPTQVPNTSPAGEAAGPLVKVDEAAMLPLLGYFQLLQRMSPQELVRERTILGAIPQTPATQVRLAMLLGQVRGPQDIYRAQSLLDGVLKSKEPAATSLHPLARVLAYQYSEWLKLQTQNEKLTGQNEKLMQQLNDGLLRSAELQEKLDALADIERSLPVRPKNGKTTPGSPR